MNADGSASSKSIKFKTDCKESWRGRKKNHRCQQINSLTGEQLAPRSTRGLRYILTSNLRAGENIQAGKWPLLYERAGRKQKSFHHPIDAVHMVEHICSFFFVCSGSGSNDAQLKTHMQRTS